MYLMSLGWVDLCQVVVQMHLSARSNLFDGSAMLN